MNFYLSGANAFLFVGYKWMLDRSSDFLFGRILSENCTCVKEQDVCFDDVHKPCLPCSTPREPSLAPRRGKGGGELGERKAKLKEPENATVPGNE